MNKILFKTLKMARLSKPQKATLGSAGFDLLQQSLIKYSKPNETN